MNKWYLALVYRQSGKKARTWVLVHALNGMDARALGASAAAPVWPKCRGMSALVLADTPAKQAQGWLRERLRGKKPRRPRGSTEVSIAFDALFACGPRIEQIDRAMLQAWTCTASEPLAAPHRDEEER